MLIWISTGVLLLLLVAIVINEIKCGRRSQARLAKTNEQINDLARSTFDRHRDLFGKEPTGTFPIVEPHDVKK